MDGEISESVHGLPDEGNNDDDEERPRSAIKIAREVISSRKPAINPVAKLEAYLAKTE